MRLWHIDLLPKLPRQQLLGQWREVLALLGNGWNKKHSTVDYVFTYSDRKLMKYADSVFSEMIERGYKPNLSRIIEAIIRRYKCDPDTAMVMFLSSYEETGYLEHNESYLDKCIQNLARKGIVINFLKGVNYEYK